MRPGRCVNRNRGPKPNLSAQHAAAQHAAVPNMQLSPALDVAGDIASAPAPPPSAGKRLARAVSKSRQQRSADGRHTSLSSTVACSARSCTTFISPILPFVAQRSPTNLWLSSTGNAGYRPVTRLARLLRLAPSHSAASMRTTTPPTQRDPVVYPGVPVPRVAPILCRPWTVIDWLRAHQFD